MVTKGNKETSTAVTYDKGDLINASLTTFNVAPEVMVGALYDVTEVLTIAQAKERLKAYLERPITN